MHARSTRVYIVHADMFKVKYYTLLVLVPVISSKKKIYIPFDNMAKAVKQPLASNVI